MAENADRFDARHLMELFKRGLINEMPAELGPIPIVDTPPSVWEDLVRWNVVDNSTFQFTSDAAKLFSGLVSYEWALWGVVLHNNQRRKVEARLPEEFRQYGVQYAIRDIPRDTFLIAVKGTGITTIVSVAGGHLEIGYDEARSSSQVFEHVARIVERIHSPDKDKQWAPYPIKRVSVPWVVSSSLATERTNDPEALSKSVKATTRGLSLAGMTVKTTKTIEELLQQDNVANVQLCLTVSTPTGRVTALNNSVGVMFFVGEYEGYAVSYPRRSADGSLWITYEPGSVEAVVTGIAAMRDGLGFAPKEDIRTS
ncbi:hypothetical protein BKG82_26555 [Mycobacteroides chelonae]|uniref:ESX secretion-associated protein EspG n=1 Tax=Mycobacteroides chelonae TaxID=1774 RepID=A0A1S1LHF1_MYCCH|nr:hypothetical protein [Mycobacteroides chelonae]OHU47219.1 hypothetical protein BKG82_26555 [Mycobacteroides chelonae]